MDERKKVGVILTRMNPTLRKYLNLDEEFYLELKATVPEVISNDEHQEIQAISVTSKRIDRLADLMKRKSMNVFLKFMRVLREKDYDLYKNVEAFQNDDRTGEKYSRAENDVLSVATTHDTKNLENGAAAASPLGWVPLGYAEERAFSNTNVNRPLTNSLRGWRQTGQFSTDTTVSGTDTNGFYPLAISIRPDGNLVVLGVSRRRLSHERIVKVFSRDGLPENKVSICKHGFYGSITLLVDGVTELIDYHRVLAITPDNGYLFSFLNQIVSFDTQGRCNSIISTYGIKQEEEWVLGPGSSHGFRTPNTLAVDSQGLIIAGLRSNTIAIYNEDGCRRFKFKTSAEPRSLDVTSKGEIAVTLNDKSLQVIDYSGNNVRVAKRPRDVYRWAPDTVCCSKQNEIFVVNRGDNSVYRYTADGERCLGCIVPGLDYPRDIAVTEDGQQLYVVECCRKSSVKSLVKIFQRQ